MYIAQPNILAGDELEALRRIIRQVDLAPGPGGSRITPVPERFFVELHTLVDSLLPSTQWVQVRAIALYPSSQLVSHRDAPIKGVRFHVPVDINAGCWYFHDGLWQQLQAGAAYEMDPLLEHGAVNWGHEIRTHLMVDIVV